MSVMDFDFGGSDTIDEVENHWSDKLEDLRVVELELGDHYCSEVPPDQVLDTLLTADQVVGF